jgi:hypothetical protein
LYKGAGGRDKIDAGECSLELGFGVEEKMILAAVPAIGRAIGLLLKEQIATE